jgi:hypothetical protein
MKYVDQPRQAAGPYIQYAGRIRGYLLANDTKGITQQELYQATKTRKYRTVEDLTTILNAWLKREWVDKYQDPTYKDRVYWRATQKLYDEWSIVNGVVTEAIAGSGLPLVLNHDQS